MTLSLSKNDVKAKVYLLPENHHQLKGTRSRLRQFLATEQPLTLPGLGGPSRPAVNFRCLYPKNEKC